jgi:hypothetical protein
MIWTSSYSPCKTYKLDFEDAPRGGIRVVFKSKHGSLKLDEFESELYFSEEPFYVFWLSGCSCVMFGRNGYNSQVYNYKDNSYASFGLTYSPDGVPYEGFPFPRHFGYELTHESIPARFDDWIGVSNPHLI